MKRDFLKSLGLEDKEVIDKIMDEYGKGVEGAKGSLSTIEQERDSLKEQLSKANETLESVKDYDEVKGQVTKYKEDLESYKLEQETTQTKNGIKAQLEAYATEKGARDVELIHSLADFDSLIGSKNQDADIKSYVDGLAESKAYLFGANEPINNAVGATTGGEPITLEDSKLSALKAAMGL